MVAYFITPYAIAKQGTGALGAAAALLFGLFLISRLIVASASSMRRCGSGGSGRRSSQEASRSIFRSSSEAFLHQLAVTQFVLRAWRPARTGHA